MPKSEFAADVTWGRVLSIWWALAWRMTLFGMLLGAVLGGIGGLIVGLAGRPDLGGSVGATVGWLGSIPLSILVLGFVLKKRYGSFSVRLLPHNGPG